MKDYNTAENKYQVVPKEATVSFTSSGTSYTFPKFSYTIITLKPD